MGNDCDSCAFYVYDEDYEEYEEEEETEAGETEEYSGPADNTIQVDVAEAGTGQTVNEDVVEFSFDETEN